MTKIKEKTEEGITTEEFNIYTVVYKMSQDDDDPYVKQILNKTLGLFITDQYKTQNKNSIKIRIY